MNGHHASYAVIGYVLLTAVAVLAVYYRWSRRKLLGAVANMDGPLSLPLIGHAYLLFKFTSEGGRILCVWCEVIIIRKFQKYNCFVNVVVAWKASEWTAGKTVEIQKSTK